MNSERREVLDNIARSMRAGRMRRRTFLERAVALGLTSSAALSLLEACGGSSGASTTTIAWTSEHNASAIMVYEPLVKTFNQTNTNHIHVIYHSGPASTDQFRTNTITMLRARNASNDLLSLDIIWPAEFASNQWTVALDQKWPASERAKYLPGPIQGCTYNGNVWAAPLRTDVGLIYYRTDVISTPPQSWDELTNLAQQAQGQGKTPHGYVWQGAQYEGMVCNFVEMLYGYGGSVLDPNNPTKVTVNSPEAQQALAKMVSWIGTISPTAITTYKEEEARAAWQDGDSSFMRNWPYAYALGNDAKTSKIAGKFEVHPMLYGGSNALGHSAIGGWQLAINAFSSPEKQDAAWKFIEYMLGPGPQKQLAIQASLAVTLSSIYDDAEVIKSNPLFGRLKSILHNARPRPVSALYPEITYAIQLRIHNALTKQSSPAGALSLLQTDLEQILARK